jgi:glutathionylspermidine synthase
MPHVSLAREAAPQNAAACRALEPLDPAALDRVRCRMVLEHCKWDPQVGDAGTLAPFPLAIFDSTWRKLARWAELLSAEAAAAEAELLARPELHRRLGLPRGIRHAIGRFPVTPGAARIVRFDFHPTTNGWQISEANSDVPGGFTEASSFPHLMAAHYPGLRTAGDPTERWAESMSARIDACASVAMLVAPGYMEDQQVVRYLAAALGRRGIATRVCDPRQLRWSSGRAFFEDDFGGAPIAAVVRFYQGEWFARASVRSGWPALFSQGATLVSNPGSALLIESKRFPLVWDALHAPLPTWRTLLPETHDPRDVNWIDDLSWILKAAFCNNGDEVAIRGISPPAHWRRAARSARWNPSGWVAQRRFDALAIPTPLGPMRPCLGVYIIDGKAGGIYGRMTHGAVIDYASIDVAVLIENDAPEGGDR